MAELEVGMAVSYASASGQYQGILKRIGTAICCIETPEGEIVVKKRQDVTLAQPAFAKMMPTKPKAAAQPKTTYTYVLAPPNRGAAMAAVPTQNPYTSVPAPSHRSSATVELLQGEVERLVAAVDRNETAKAK